MSNFQLIETGLGLGIDDHIPNFNFNEQVFEPFEGIEDYVLNENPNYSKIHHLDLSSMVKELKSRYPELSQLKKVSLYHASPDSLKPFIEYIKTNPDKAFDVILDPDIFFPMDNKSHPYYQSLTILDKEFALVYKRDHVRQSPLCFIFFNDYNFLMDKFFKNDIRKYPPGNYELAMKNSNYVLNPIEVKFVEDPILDEVIASKIHTDIECFFNNKEFYKANNLPRKRGIIVHGPHGNGKTTLIKSVLHKYTETYRVLIDCRLFDQSLSEFLNQVFPKDKDKVIVFEDVESISEGGHRSYGKRSSFLNFIDGPKTMENTLFVATTNHPDLVDPALIDRPSRFDRIYKVDLPDDECRKKFLLKYFPNLKDSPDLLEYIRETKNFSGAYFKELFIVVGIQNSSLSEAIQDIKKQIKVRREGKFDSSRNVGLHKDENY